jgi:hypothetical protein
MIYESRRSDAEPAMDDDGGWDGGASPGYDPDLYQDRPLQYPQRSADDDHSKLGELKDRMADKASEVSHRAKEKLAEAGHTAKEKISRVGTVAREKASAIGEQAAEKFDELKAGTNRAYERTKEKVATMGDEHPLELGFACLAAGVIAGLAMPTPRPVQRRLGPAAERLRERTREAGREIIAKGRHVADAAVGAAKDEAKAQGLTPEALTATAGADNDATGSKPQDDTGITEASQSGP